MTKQATLLKPSTEKSVYKITIKLQEGRTALFEYSDRYMAREHFEQLQFHGVIGGVAIRDIKLEEVRTGS